MLVGADELQVVQDQAAQAVCYHHIEDGMQPLNVSGTRTCEACTLTGRVQVLYTPRARLRSAGPGHHRPADQLLNRGIGHVE